ncbi:LuxR C-terminal-related transcriptional regulator [Intrasporangium flavum]|uniref:LuxR C-terminal-related transcriptional regulator n=1 Tax=Intrasporangium flavum TaxID=1428657 RepID=UPI00096F1697|nr:LuxR C-terminal-related transcriptional regulator [Intrasporangium flavum]
MTGRTERRAGQGDGRAELRAATNDLAVVATRLATDWWEGAPTPGWRLLGEGMVQIEEGLTAMEPTARRTAWSMQPTLAFDPANHMNVVDRRTVARGIDLRLITSERTLHSHPLVTSELPHVRFGPAPSRFMLIDDVTAVVGGPLSEAGYSTAWLATRDDIVTLVRSVWGLAWPLSRPGNADGAEPPFTPRQCVVARRVVVGVKDASIARELGVSLRTVAGDIAHLMDVLGARTRAEVGLVLRGGSERRIETQHGPARPRVEGRPPGT